MSLHLNDDELAKLCRQLDAIEARTRQVEASITAIRMRLRDQVSARRRHECGFVEGESENALRPMPELV